MGGPSLYAEPKKVRMERFLSRVAEPEFLDDLCDKLSDGANLAEIAREMKANYRWLYEWINNTEFPERAQKVEAAGNARDSMAKESLVGQLHSIANLDIRDAFHENGDMINPSELPEHVAKAVSSVDVIIDDTGKETRKIRFVDRGQMIALGGRRQRMFADRVEVTGQMSLEQAVMESIRGKE